MTTILGYARVSTARQSLDQQLDALTAAGADPAHTFSDVMSGARDDRPGLAELLSYARPGDTVVIVALDRLGRSLSGIIRTVQDLTERGIVLRSLRESIDTGTSVGRMLTGLFAALAEYERSLIAERAEVAREAAAARGRQTGRPRVLTPVQADQIRALHAAGTSVADLCRAFPASRATVYRTLTGTGTSQ